MLDFFTFGITICCILFTLYTSYLLGARREAEGRLQPEDKKCNPVSSTCLSRYHHAVGRSEGRRGGRILYLRE